MNVNGTDDDIPENTTLADHQVAGHKSGKGKGILKHDDGYLLKPISYNEPRGVREKWFFDFVAENSSSDEIIASLSSFIPKYHGVWTNPSNNELRYLCLEDIADKFQVPCIMDVKVGAITYDPMATEDKMFYEKTKYPYVETVKFRILGMKVFDEHKKEYFSLGRPFGKQLSPDLVLDALHMYLRKDANIITSYILFGFIHHLKVIENFFKRQKRFGFFASSLLFLYEGKTSNWVSTFPELQGDSSEKSTARKEVESAMDTLMESIVSSKAEHSRNSLGLNASHLNGRGNGNSRDDCEFCGLKRDTCNKIRSECFVDVKMIDFAHVFLSAEIDNNYLLGLRNLINHFVELNRKIVDVK